MADVWEDGVWAPGVWEDGVWVGDTGPAPSPGPAQFVLVTALDLEVGRVMKLWIDASALGGGGVTPPPGDGGVVWADGVWAPGVWEPGVWL